MFSCYRYLCSLSCLSPVTGGVLLVEHHCLLADSESLMGFIAIAIFNYSTVICFPTNVVFPGNLSFSKGRIFRDRNFNLKYPLHNCTLSKGYTALYFKQRS